MANDFLNKAIISLAFVKANWDRYKSSYLDNFIPFLSTLFIRKNYTHIEEKHESIARLIVDFKDEFGLNIPYYPMVSIINRAKVKGLIKKQEHKYLPTSEIHKYDFTNKVEQEIRKYGKIIESFINFSEEEYSIKLSKEEAEETLIYFLKKYDLDILFAVYEKSALPEVKISKRENFIFSKFVQGIYNRNYELFQLFLDIIIAHILMNAVFYGESLKNFVGPKLKELNLYLDTRIIFRLLGTEGEEVQSVYRNLLKELGSQGVNLFIFSHTYDEISNILQGCLSWIEKYDYDPSKASRVLRFFKSEGFKESDVQMFIDRLDRVLKEYSITKVEPPNYSDYSNYLIDEKKLEEFIEEVYKIDPELIYEKDFTIQRDIRSISAIYMLRKGQKPTNIKQAKQIFVTTNSSLAYAARRFEREIQYGEGFYIPACLTDTFIGTIIWLRNPNKVIEISKKKVMANVYSALQPSEELLRQYVAEVKKLKEKGEITEDDYILLRDFQVAKELLGERLLGDPQRFTPRTPIEVLDIIKSEGYKEYKREKEEHEQTKKELEKEREERKKTYERYNRKAEKWSNILAAILLGVFILFSILSRFKIEGIFKWIILIICSVFGIIGLLGLTIKTLKRKVKNLILDKVFGIRNEEHVI